MFILFILLAGITRSGALLSPEDLRRVSHFQRRFSLLFFLLLLLRLLSLVYLFGLLIQQLMLQQGLIAQQVFLTVVLAIEFTFLNSFAKTAMVDEVSTTQLAQKSFLLVGTHEALKLLNFDVKLLAFDDVPASIFAEIAGKSSGQKVRESPRIFEFNSDQSLLTIQFFLHFSVLTFSPLLLGPVLADKAMFDMSAQLETILTESYIFTMHTFVDCFVCSDFPELASIAVVIVLLPYFFIDNLLFEHILFLFNLANDIWGLLVSAKRTFDNSIVFDFVFGPLAKTVQMESIPANRSTRSSCITFDDLHVTYGAKVIFILILFFEDDIAPWDLDFGIFKEIFDFVVMYSSIGDDISEFLVIVFVPEDEGVVFGDVEDVGECVEGVYTVPVVGIFAGALEFIADGDFELGAVYIFKNKASSACDANQIKLLPALQQHLNFFLFQLLVFLFVRLRHTTINIIRSPCLSGINPNHTKHQTYRKLQQKIKCILLVCYSENILSENISQDWGSLGLQCFLEGSKTLQALTRLIIEGRNWSPYCFQLEALQNSAIFDRDQL